MSFAVHPGVQDPFTQYNVDLISRSAAQLAAQRPHQIHATLDKIEWLLSISMANCDRIPVSENLTCLQFVNFFALNVLKNSISDPSTPRSRKSMKLLERCERLHRYVNLVSQWIETRIKLESRIMVPLYFL